MNPGHLDINIKSLSGDEIATNEEQTPNWSISQTFYIERDSQSENLCNPGASLRVSNSRTSNITKLPTLEPYRTTEGQLTFDITIHSELI